MREEQIIILGAGPAGVAAGLALGRRALVLESRQDLGGLCRTIELDGAVFDLGGHSFHSPNPEVRELVSGALELYEQKREARCFTHGEMIPYPFQEHFQLLPDRAIVQDCQTGLQSAGSADGASDFEDFVGRRFGYGIARHFLLPYNRKLWKVNLRDLATDWVGERVVGAAQERVGIVDTKESRPLHKRKPLQSDSTVAYPARGGFGEIMRALARQLPRLVLGTRAAMLDPVKRELVLAGGEALRFRRLISTLPLPRLLAIMSGVPATLTAAAAGLRSLPLAVVLVVIGHPVDTPVQRIYCAEPGMAAHKVVVNHNSSVSLRALPHHGVLAEVSLPPGQTPSPGLERQVLHELGRMGILKSCSAVRSTQVINVPDAYPIPTHSRNAIVGAIKAWLEQHDIHSVGRFGEWAYINSDEALARGLALGKRLADL
jgi:protoporphyrinogen oxidase